MLGFLFGFNARLGRLQFFLATVALGVAMTAICVALAMTLLHHTSPGAIRIEEFAGSWAIIAVVAGFGFATFMLQSMRIRDIGWDPVCVIPGWIALMIIDHLVAVRFPAWSVGGEHHATVVGGLVNLALMLALTFWPSGDSDGALANPFQTSSAQAKPLVSTDRLARAAQGSPRPTWR